MDEHLEDIKTVEIPEFIWEDKQLDLQDKMALLTLWSARKKSRKVIITPAKFSRLAAVNIEAIFNILQKLDQLNLIELIEYDSDRKIEVNLLLPEENIEAVMNMIETENESPDTPADRLIAAWNQTFPGCPLTPANLTHLTAHLERGVEIELIEELIKYTSRAAKGNPFSYLLSILNNLQEESITTLAEYQQQKGEHEADGRQISGDNKRKEKRDKLQDFEELDKREDWN